MIDPKNTDTAERAAELGAAMRRSGGPGSRAHNPYLKETTQHAAWDKGYVAEARAEEGQSGVVVHSVVGGTEDPDYDIT